MNNAQRNAERRSKRLRPMGGPVTSNDVYADDEMEFLRAVDRFRVDRGISYPSLTDLLRILKSLGYRKP